MFYIIQPRGCYATMSLLSLITVSFHDLRSRAKSASSSNGLLTQSSSNDPSGSRSPPWSVLRTRRFVSMRNMWPRYLNRRRRIANMSSNCGFVAMTRLSKLVITWMHRLLKPFIIFFTGVVIAHASQACVSDPGSCSILRFR